jgi:hypothetical protein
MSSLWGTGLIAGCGTGKSYCEVLVW